MEQFEKNKRVDVKEKKVLEIFDKHQQSKKDKRQSGKSRRNVLRRNLCQARRDINEYDTYNKTKQMYIKVFKDENQGFDLNDPCQDHNLEIKEYDILDSEPESDSDDKSTIEEEV